jgi:hypothetical protein
MHIRAKLSASIVAAIALTAAVGNQTVRAEHLTVVPGEVADKQAYVTNKGIRWYTSLDEAEAEARKQGKLVFWLHMLGTIDGAT